MTTFRIQGGTPRGSESLCDSCYWSHIQKGYAESEEVVLCAFLRQPRLIAFKVRQCTDYNDKRIPSKRDMEDIAWIIRTKDVTRRLGFAAEERMTEEENEELEIVPAD